MNVRNKLVQGVGRNDVDYPVRIIEVAKSNTGKKKQKVLWSCPFYTVWAEMLRRCYNIKLQEKRPTYIGCSVCEEWLTFSNFKKWMETQDWEGKELDKDLLYKNNKIYSPNTCLFVSQRVNKFLTERGARRGDFPIGVSYLKRSKKMVNELSKPYIARVRNGLGKDKYLGMFSTAQEAHEAWLSAKIEMAKQLAIEILSEGGDPRIAQALVDRYENYTVEYA